MKDIYHANTSKMPFDKLITTRNNEFLPNLTSYFLNHPNIDDPIRVFISGGSRHFETVNEFLYVAGRERQGDDDLPSFIINYCLENNRLPAKKEIDKWKVQEALK